MTAKYYTGPKSAPGFLALLDDPNGVEYPTVLQARVITDEDGEALGTSANPIYVAASGGGEAVTIADGADVAEGTTTDIAYTDATGAAAGTVMKVLKGLFVNLANILLAVDTLEALTTAMSAKLPAALGAATSAASLSVVPASDATFTTKPIRETTATVVQVADANADTSLFASNAARLPGSTITNDSTAILYILLGAGAASATNYSVAIAGKTTVGGTFTLPDGFTGAVRGFWDANTAGFAYTTELSA